MGTNFYVGKSGTGVATINGGSLACNDTYIGDAPGSTGIVTVTTGTFSSWHVYIGNSGTGTLAVNGGNLGIGDQVYMGYKAGSYGTAVISSGQWVNFVGVEVGGSGTALLTINGGSVTRINTVGNAAGSSGTVAITSGSGSCSATQFYIGYSGAGALLIDGGVMTDNAGCLGYNAGSNGTALITGGTWNNSSNVYVGYSGAGTLSISGSGSVVALSGSGSVILSASTGSSGTLNIGSGGSAGTLRAAAVTGSSGSATVNFNHSGSLAFAPSLTGSLKVNKLGPGTTMLTGSSTYSGNTTISTGTLQFGNGSSSGAFSVTGAITGSTGAILAFNHSDAITVANKISGGVGLSQLGAGTLTLSGSNAFTGPTTVASGTLLLKNQYALAGSTVGSGGAGLVFDSSVTGHAFVFGGLSGTDGLGLADNGSNTVALTVGGNNASTAYAGALSGGGSLTKIGSGVLTLTGSNTYTGPTTITAGTLVINNDSALGATSGVVTLYNGGTLRTGANFDFGANRNFAVSGGTATLDTQGYTNTVNGPLSGAGVLAKSGTGTLILSGSVGIGGLTASNGDVQLAQSGTIGAISIGAAGKLELSANNINSAKVLDTSSLSIAAGGTLDLWDNALILRDQTGGINQGANLSTIQGLVHSAFDNGNWDKPGITSSTVIADLSAYSVLTVMVYDNTVLGVDSFEGINGLQTDNGGNQVMLKTTYLSDFDGNGIVNSADYGWLDFYFSYGLTLGDLNGDGLVNSADYNGIDYGYSYQAYGTLAGGAAMPAASAASAAAPALSEPVPEPGVFGLLLTGALGLRGFRRKSNRDGA